MSRTDTLVCPVFSPAKTEEDRQECLSYKILLRKTLRLCVIFSSTCFHSAVIWLK
jgi:hypothetical protein